MSALTRVLIWISGASSGIGAALAATVPFDAVEIVDLSRRGGTPNTQHVAVDLADPASWPLVERDFTERLARFDGDRVVFVHNAGTLTPLGRADLVDSAAYTRNVLLNSAASQVLGHFFLRAVADLDCDQHLVMITSGAARNPFEGESSYCAGKAAIDQWVRVVGREQSHRDPGCRVVAIAPGSVDTAMQDEIRGTGVEDFPESDRFRDLWRDGALSPPETTAKTIWSLLDRDLDNGAVLHIKDLL